jgi:hypothetical protein
VVASNAEDWITIYIKHSSLGGGVNEGCSNALRHELHVQDKSGIFDWEWILWAQISVKDECRLVVTNEKSKFP